MSRSWCPYIWVYLLKLAFLSFEKKHILSLKNIWGKQYQKYQDAFLTCGLQSKGCGCHLPITFVDLPAFCLLECSETLSFVGTPAQPWNMWKISKEINSLNMCRMLSFTIEYHTAKLLQQANYFLGDIFCFSGRLKLYLLKRKIVVVIVLCMCHISNLHPYLRRANDGLTTLKKHAKSSEILILIFKKII